MIARRSRYAHAVTRKRVLLIHCARIGYNP